MFGMRLSYRNKRLLTYVEWLTASKNSANRSVFDPSTSYHMQRGAQHGVKAHAKSTEKAKFWPPLILNP